jgi:signal transduction histidine kinase/HPt (histidine-containing phosphotransfer) domain-containing protein
MLDFLKSLEVVVVDPDEAGREALCALLAGRGFEVVPARSGLQAFDLLRERGMPLVVARISAGGAMNGLELCRRIRSAEEISFTYVILLSDQADGSDIQAAFEAGADDYLRRPMDERELLARLYGAERVIALETLYRRHALQLHKVNAEVAVINGRLQRLTAELEASRDRARQAQAEAERACSFKSSFLADMSHEIRSPMTSILGYAEFLHSEGDLSRAPTDRVEAIDAILRSSHHLLDVINNLLDHSRIEAGKVQVERSRFSPAELVRDVCGLLGLRARSKGLTLEAESDGSIPATMESDPTRLRQILINLVTNAIRYTRTGGVRLRVRHLGGPAERMQFDVIDTGPGISAEELSRLFARFEQAGGAAAAGGTGLGLAISRQLARMLGGDVTATSRPGEGSTFRVEVEAGRTEGTGALEGAIAAREPEPGFTVPCRILLAEDGEDNRRLLAHHLRKAGAHVGLAENGRLAVEMALAAAGAGEAYDAVLMDMEMPVLDGYAAVRRLRSGGYRGLVIGLTGHTLPGDREKCLTAGCDDYAAKPISRRRLIELVRRGMQKGITIMGEAVQSKAPLVSDLAGDPDMAELVEMFVDELPARVSAIQSSLASQDFDALQRLAHQLKGSAGGYGFPTITDAAKTLEQNLKAARDLSAMAEQVRELADLCSRAQARAPQA